MHGNPPEIQYRHFLLSTCKSLHDRTPWVTVFPRRAIDTWDSCVASVFPLIGIADAAVVAAFTAFPFLKHTVVCFLFIVPCDPDGAAQAKIELLMGSRRKPAMRGLTITAGFFTVIQGVVARRAPLMPW